MNSVTLVDLWQVTPAVWAPLDQWRSPLQIFPALTCCTLPKLEAALRRDAPESQLALDREVVGSRYERAGKTHTLLIFISCLFTLLMSKNPNLKASYDSSPLCRVTLWLSLAFLVLPSLQHGKAPTSSSSSDSPCPTPATLQAWTQVKASDFWSCSSWSEEGDFEPCLLVILPPFLSTLNPVYLLHRKLALSLSLLRAWLSGLYSTYRLTWQRPITMWNRSSQGTVV